MINTGWSCPTRRFPIRTDVDGISVKVLGEKTLFLTVLHYPLRKISECTMSAQRRAGVMDYLLYIQHSIGWRCREPMICKSLNDANIIDVVADVCDLVDIAFRELRHFGQRFAFVE